LGCGISTGYGVALNTAGVEPGSTVAIWGLSNFSIKVCLYLKLNENDLKKNVF
jgi:S-(hydroxymethyl)glutathione dehydrogenase/alcohol dehydrogenase